MKQRADQAERERDELIELLIVFKPSPQYIDQYPAVWICPSCGDRQLAGSDFKHSENCAYAKMQEKISAWMARKAA